MFSRLYNSYPNRLRALPFLAPRMGPFSLLVTLSGVVAIAGFFAPEFVEQALPGWRDRLGALVLLGVMLGLVRALWRLVVPIMGVVFWLMAAFCAFRPEIPSWGGLGSVIGSSGSRREPQVYSTSASGIGQRPLPPALPDSAYFAPRSASGSLRRGVTSFVDLVRNI